MMPIYPGALAGLPPGLPSGLYGGPGAMPGIGIPPGPPHCAYGSMRPFDKQSAAAAAAAAAAAHNFNIIEHIRGKHKFT